MCTHSGGIFQQHTDAKSIQTHLATPSQSPTQWVTSTLVQWLKIKYLSVILSSISLPTSISESIFRSDWLFPQNTPSGLFTSLSFYCYHFHQCPSSPPYNSFLTLLTTSTVSLTPTVNAANVICQNKTDQISLSFCITVKCKARLCMI